MAEKGDIQALEEYHRKRDFNRTPEPSGSGGREGDIFVVQKHAASHLHYDFRLRLHGALKSWAVPKGPSLDPSQQRLAEQTEDHPIPYAEFEGVIPAGNYGAGNVMIWDEGVWEPLGGGKRDYYQGKLRFILHGKRLRGAWSLTREKGEAKKWYLVKEEDEFASTEDILLQDTSVVTGRTLEEIGADRDRLWTREQGLVVEEKKVFGHRDGGSFPGLIVPQAATLLEKVPSGDEWLHEIKYDGYRMVCRIDAGGGGARFYTRKGYDFTDRLRTLRRAVGRLPIERGWLDGEIVVFTPEGRSDFHALQNAFRSGRDRGIVYAVFDLMNYEGYDIRSAPLVERKALLAELIPPMDEVRYVEHIVGQGDEFYQVACSRQLEGILSKQADSEYQSQRTRSWVKVKCAQRQEFVVGGYTESLAGRPFGSLLAGYYNDKGELVFAGKIKTGYSAESSQSLLETMRKYEQAEPSFVNPPSGEEYRNPHWLRPALVAEANYTELSGTGLLRHASFKGLREDKDPREVRLEIPQSMPEELEPEIPGQEVPGVAMGAAAGGDERGGGAGKDEKESRGGRTESRQEVMHPRRGEAKPQPVYPHERITREQILDYYSGVAPLMLPHLTDRPLTLIFCRTNIYACSFKKHATNFPWPVKAIDAGHEERYIAIDSVEGLQTLVGMGAIEFHGWQSRYINLERPDRLLFDLDPPEEPQIEWERLAEAALLVRIHLQEHGLESYLQTTGGKGYYVVAPLRPGAPWKVVTGFAKRTANELEAKYPERFTAKLAKEERGGRIYVDWMRNGRGAHAAEPYSLRARPGATIATPITWEELVTGIKPDSYHFGNIRERVGLLTTDPWEGFFELNQKLSDFQ
jgi:bifunctional non-homologous end joining protein LigD